jgi:hypothetical protein
LATDGEVEFLEVPVEVLMSFGPEGFDITGKPFLAGGLGGLSTFGDSLLGALFFVGEVEGIS